MLPATVLRREERPGPLGTVSYEYVLRSQWPRTAPGTVILVPVALFDPGGRLWREQADPTGRLVTVGPYRLRVVGPVYWDYLAAPAVRAGARAWGYIALYRCAAPLRTFGRRVLLTAMVWGWGDPRPGSVPSWRDLRPPWKRGRR